MGVAAFGVEALGVAALGVAALGVAVLGVAALGVSVFSTFGVSTFGVVFFDGVCASTLGVETGGCEMVGGTVGAGSRAGVIGLVSGDLWVGRGGLTGWALCSTTGVLAGSVGLVIGVCTGVWWNVVCGVEWVDCGLGAPNRPPGVAWLA